MKVQIERERIMVVEDNRLSATFIGNLLEQSGYGVLKAESGLEALRLVQLGRIDLMLLDIVMPDMDGYEVLRQLRNDTRTYNTPIILLSSHHGTKEKVKGFELGADDYITKPFVPAELLARIMAHLRRSKLRLDSNPLTGLPGNTSIEDELAARTASKEPLAVLYVDIDRFKAFNDAYGFLQGDEMIRSLAGLLEETAKRYGGEEDLVGHIGGDDFVVLTSPERVDLICEKILSGFESLTQEFAEGDSDGLDAMSLSIAAVTNEYVQFDNHWEISQVAASLKKRAKAEPKNVYIKSSPPPAGDGHSKILIVSTDTALHDLFRAAYKARGIEIIPRRTVLDAAHFLKEQRPLLLVLDLSLSGSSGLAFCRRLRATLVTRAIPVIVIADSEHRESALDTGITAFVEKPYSKESLVAAVDHSLTAIPL